MLQGAFLIILFMLVQCGPCHGKSFYDDPYKGHEGWYGYQEYGKNETVEKSTNATLAMPRKKAIKWPSKEEAMKMRPSQLKKVLEKAADVAIGNPTEANVLRWVSYMEVASKKSWNFANVVAWVRQQHPELNAALQHPDTYSGKKAAAQARWYDMQTLLNESKDDFAILLFVSKNSPLSPVAEKICRQFADEHGWTVRLVDVEKNPELVTAMGVNAVPQAWVISRKGFRPFVAMTGTVTVSDLETAIYRGIRITTGKSEPVEYATKRPVVLIGKSTRQ